MSATKFEPVQFNGGTWEPMTQADADACKLKNGQRVRFKAKESAMWEVGWVALVWLGPFGTLAIDVRTFDGVVMILHPEFGDEVLAA